MDTAASSTETAGSGDEIVPTVTPRREVVRARVTLPGAKYAIVRETVMNDNISTENYYAAMSKALENLKVAVNKKLSSKIDQSKKRRSSGVPSKSEKSSKIKKIIV